ncbi:MAG: SAM-dependent chlorinase/fluorinase, partial [Salibacteraceae bacterium]
LALVKAKILTQLPDAHIIDISHNIANFDIAEAAFILKMVLDEFPKDTIHIVGVGSQDVDKIEHLGVRYKNQYILTANNGFLSLIAEQHPDTLVELTMNIESDVLTFPVRDLYAPAAAYLANGGTLEVIGRKVENTVSRMMIHPTTGSDYIHGRIVYVDKYGNAISNIHQSLFKKIRQDRGFLIGFVHKGYEIDHLSQRYGDVPKSERLALFNSGGYLEIAINEGHASDLLGLDKSETIIITFG